MDYSVDGRSYTLLACWISFLAYLFGLRGCHWPWAWVNGMRYWPRSSCVLIRMGFLWHVINTSSSFYTVTTLLVKMEKLPSSDALPTLINDVGNYSNVSVSAALLKNLGKGILVTYLPLHAPPSATPTFLAETRNIGRPNDFLSFLLQ